MTEIELESFIEKFEDHSLPAKEWTHEAHLITATYKYLSVPDDTIQRGNLPKIQPQ